MTTHLHTAFKWSVLITPGPDGHRALAPVSPMIEVDFMKHPVRTILVFAAILSFIVIVIITILFLEHGFYDDAKLQIKYFEVFGVAYKTIGIGFISAVLVAVIPQLLPETKYVFNRYKDSRIAYSEAKTGIDYLPYKLATLSYDQGMALVQEVHEKFHVAQTYDELKEHLAPYNDPEKWGAKKYIQLKAMRDVLGTHIKDWKKIEYDARLNELLGEIRKAG